MHAKTWFKREASDPYVLHSGLTVPTVAKAAIVIGKGAAINVARSDLPTVVMTSAVLANEGWF